MEIAETSKAKNSSCVESTAHITSSDAEALACDASETSDPPYPSIEDFDNVGPAVGEVRTFELPPDILEILSEDAPGRECIYLAHNEGWIIEAPKLDGYRTRKSAENIDVITDIPSKMAIITAKPFQNALTFNQYVINKKIKEPDAAHMWPIKPDRAGELQYSDRKSYLRGMDASCMMLDDDDDGDLNKTVALRESIAKIDLPLLQCLYSIILNDVEIKSNGESDALQQMLKNPQYAGHFITIYVPDLLNMMGYKLNCSSDMIFGLIERIENYTEIVGLIADSDDGSEQKRAYPMMIFDGYNIDNNTIRFSCPYLYVLAIRVLLFQSKPGRKPCHSRRIEPSIAKKHEENDIRAFEVVCVVVRLLAQSGDYPPHILWKNLLDRCPYLSKTLKTTGPTNKSNVLKRAFQKAWKHLKDYTNLDESYVLPDPDNPIFYPTLKTLDKTLEIPHKKSGNKT